MSSASLPRAAGRLARRLFGETASAEAFLGALERPHPYAPAVLWARGEPPSTRPFAVREKFGWQPDGVDFLPPGERPGTLPEHQRGELYVLDPSSVFAGAVLAGLPEVDTLLDLCASPGGKSLLGWRLLRPRLLLANEVIGKRLGPLVSNFERCGVHPARIFQRDPSRWATEAAGSARVVLVDAPCSGQSLLARGKPVPGAFHPATENLNVKRQRRILAHAAECVVPGGWLAYMTCTFSEKENEGNLRWFLKQRPDFQPEPAPALEAFRSHLADFPCYRLWPQQGIGAGAFTVRLRREGAATESATPPFQPVWTSRAAADGS